MAHVSMRLEEVVRDADPVVVTTSSNVRGETVGRLMDSQRRTLTLSPPSPPPPQPSLSYALPEENHLEG